MDKMDTNEALELVRKGSTLLLLDVPQLTLVGIDTQIFSVGPLFKGIKMIPPGPHFVYYRSANREGSEFSPVVGFFIMTAYSEVIVRKWNQQEERLVKLLEEEEGSYTLAVKQLEFDKQLGPYPLDHFGKWKNLSNYITKESIERLEPIGGEISMAYEPLPIEALPQTTMAKDVQKLRNDTMSSSVEKLEKRSCYYTLIPRVFKQKDISQEELTALNLDKTVLLDTVLKDSYGDSPDLLLGELQFSFVAFLMGQSLEAFYQWKRLVSLLFGCTEAPLHSRSQMFTKVFGYFCTVQLLLGGQTGDELLGIHIFGYKDVKFIRTLYYQLKYGYNEEITSTSGSNKGFSIFLEESWISKDIFLYLLCKEFFSLIEEANVIDGDLLTWTKKLKKLLETTFGWEYHETFSDMIYDEDDEFAPVVVPSTEISPSYAESSISS